MLSRWAERPLEDLLAAHGLTGVIEEPFANDGWSGATLTQLRRGDDRFVLKRTSLAQDWIARATRDDTLREGQVATGDLALPPPLVSPYLGAAADGEQLAILMPDLTGQLLAWERPDGAPTLTPAVLDRVLDAMARLHAAPVTVEPVVGAVGAWPWCPLPERLLLLTRPAAQRYVAEAPGAGSTAGVRFLEGWAAFDRAVPPAARDLVHDLGAHPAPLLDALAVLPDALLHGDLKVANVALFDDGAVACIDWQMVLRAPIAVELGWFLVANSSALPLPPDAVFERYLAAAAAIDPRALGDVETQRDLTWIVGLLLRGWRKGFDADAGHRLASGVPAADDLAWWCERALDAAARRL